MNDFPQGFSIIICCYNSAGRITTTLEHIRNLVVPEGWLAELIVVNNNSTDNTVAVVNQLYSTPTDIPLRVVSEPKPGQTHARIKGMDTARFSHFLFCDDDNWLAQDYLVELSRLIRKYPDAGAIGGHGEAVSSIALPYFFSWVGLSYGTGMQQAAEGPRSGTAPWMYGAGLAVCRSAWRRALEVFPESFTSGRSGSLLTGADDNELCYKLGMCGFPLIYSNALRFQHFMDPARLNIDYLLRLQKGSAYSNTMLMPWLMNYRPVYRAKFYQATHWKFGYLRRFVFGLRLKWLMLRKAYPTNEVAFKRFIEMYYSMYSLTTIQQNRDKLLRQASEVAERRRLYQLAEVV